MINFYALKLRTKAPAAANQSFRYGWSVFNASGDFVGFVLRDSNDGDLRRAISDSREDSHDNTAVYELDEVTVPAKVFNERAAKPFPWREPPSRLIRYSGDSVAWFTVVGEPYSDGVSGAGNPRYGVRTITRERGEVATTHYRTMYDAAINYGIGNGWRDRRLRRAVASLTPGGSIRDLIYLDSADPRWARKGEDE